MPSPRCRHPADVVSLLLGLLMIAAAALFLLTDTTSTRIDVRWAAPVVLVSIGLIGLSASLRRRG